MKKSYTNDPVRLWYLPMILGLILIGLGVWVLATPVEFFITLSLLFAFSFIATGHSGRNSCNLKQTLYA